MLENPTTPVFLGPTDSEWHVFGTGLNEGFKFRKRKPPTWDENKYYGNAAGYRKAPVPGDYQCGRKNHYYIFGFDSPEDFSLLCCVIYLGATNMPALVNVGVSFFGFPVDRGNCKFLLETGG